MKKLLIFLVISTLIVTAYGLYGDEVSTLKEKIIDIQNKGELGFKDFTFCSKILGFASYVPLVESNIDREGSLLIYYEPANVYTNRRNGLYEIWYKQDLALLDQDGKTIWEQKDILTFHYTTTKPVLDLYAQNTLDIEGQLPEGSYQVRVVLKDQLKGKTAVKILDIVLK